MRGWPPAVWWPNAEQLAMRASLPSPCFTQAVAEELLWAGQWVCTRREMQLRRVMVSSTGCVMSIRVAAEGFKSWNMREWLVAVPIIARRRARRRGVWSLDERLVSNRSVVTYGDDEPLPAGTIDETFERMKPHALFHWIWHGHAC